MKSPVKFSNFLFQADILAKSCGLIPYDDETQPQKFQTFKKWIFIMLVINLNLVLLEEFLFFIVTILRGENFAEATMTLAYIGFVLVSDIKMFSVLHKKSLLSQLIKDLRKLYPKELKLQEEFNTRRYMLRYNLISFGFVFTHEILIWMYNLAIVASYLIYEYWLGWRIVPRILPYHAWVPWQWQGHWSYYLLYVSQIIAGHASMCGHLVNDLLLCAVATQIIMHYRYLAQRLEKYQPTGIYKKDQEFLKNCIEYHQKILSLSIDMNKTFGVCILVNFISSSFIICFLGFQITIGVDKNNLIMILFFLFCSLLQILIICYYGQQLIEKSLSIGRAVYNHNWLKADARYRKMMILIIKRSQKPALLMATDYLQVSMSTMTDLMQLSYKFFALLRTMYSK